MSTSGKNAVRMKDLVIRCGRVISGKECRLTIGRLPDPLPEAPCELLTDSGGYCELITVGTITEIRNPVCPACLTRSTNHWADTWLKLRTDADLLASSGFGVGPGVSTTNPLVTRVPKDESGPRTNSFDQGFKTPQVIPTPQPPEPVPRIVVYTLVGLLIAVACWLLALIFGTLENSEYQHPSRRRTRNY